MHTVIFDMDGVIFDTERIYTLAWDYAGEKAGIGKAGFMNALTLGMSVDKTQEIWRRQFGDAYDEKAVRFYAREFVRDYFAAKGVPEKSGLRELLSFLKKSGWKTAVASSSPSFEVERNLALAGIDGYFDAIVCGDMVRHSKPEPDIYLEACRRLGEKPENCFAIEDSRNGIISACTAGCKTIMVPDLWECDHPTHKLLHLLASDLTEVQRHFEQLSADEQSELEELREILFDENEEKQRPEPVETCSLDELSELLFNEEEDKLTYNVLANTDNGYKIISYEDSDENVQRLLMDYLHYCEWDVGCYLGELLTNGKLLCGEDRAYFMLDGDNVVSFLTLAHTDSIDDDTKPQWIGFVYTDPQYRGCRNMGRLLAFAEDKARQKGFSEVYLATGHIGLYEKYGFSYIGDMTERNGEISRVYVFRTDA